ncbi:MAG: hypothetical protein JWO56_1984, partial [Acidobacteria bacterium]|nr:hypothetical protein [Acidobacteriota bacterium]
MIRALRHLLARWRSADQQPSLLNEEAYYDGLREAARRRADMARAV